MGRFGRAAASRNMSLFDTLDEIRHGQLQFSFPHSLLNKEPRFDWAHKAVQTNQWGAIPAAAWWNPNAAVRPAEREWLEGK